MDEALKTELEVKVAEKAAEVVAPIVEEGIKDVKAVVEKAPSPAEDLRNFQGLLLSGIFPGQVSPQVVKSYNLIDRIAKAVEDGLIVHPLITLEKALEDSAKSFTDKLKEKL